MDPAIAGDTAEQARPARDSLSPVVMHLLKGGIYQDSDPRLWNVAREEILDLIRVFLPDTSNEARLVDQIDKHINKVVELGFLRRLRVGSSGDSAKNAGKGSTAHNGGPCEVRRILKA